MRVLLTAVPALGHVVPLLDLAGALRSGGHEVRFATNVERHQVIGDAGVDAVSAGMSMAEMVAERRRRWPDTVGQPATVWGTRMWAQVMAPSMLDDLVAIVGDWLPDVVIHDEGDYAAPVAAAVAEIPCITHGWGSPLRPDSELVELQDLTAAMWSSCGLDVPFAGGLYAHALVNPCPPILQDVASGAAVVWPLRPRSLRGHGIRVRADDYVGFGTVPGFANAPDELDSAVRACASLGMRVVVTAPDPELRRRLESIDPELVTAHEFVSLPQLVASCRVVITHAGAGTVLVALTEGVPVVVVPRGSPSQTRMAEACHRAGVGRRCDATTLASTLDDVLNDPSISAAASAAAAQIASKPPATEVVPRIEALAHA